MKNRCIGSSSTDVCQFTSNAAYPNIVEISTTLPSRDKISALPRYGDSYIFNSIRNTIRKMLQIHRPIEHMRKEGSVTHLVGDQFHSTKHIQPSIQHSTNVHNENQKSDIFQISPTTSTIVLRQIANNKIAFDFLTDAELRTFLAAVISLIDKSYQIIDTPETLKLFMELIAGQSIYILRSCDINEEHSLSNQPCLIVATLFFRPVIENDNILSVYR
jgi:hypothetical protein